MNEGLQKETIPNKEHKDEFGEMRVEVLARTIMVENAEKWLEFQKGELAVAQEKLEKLNSLS